MKDHVPPVRVALYARVSSDHQAEEGTIASQLAALRQRLAAEGLTADDELQFIDDGVSGATLRRPALERLRDQAAAGAFDRLVVLAPDRLARNFALQYLLLEELHAVGITVTFLNHALGESAEGDLLLQMQGMIAEYERAKIAERTRRGRQHAARQGQVSVLTQAPYGYRYIRKADGGGTARYDIILEEARVVRQIFSWVGQERLTLSEVARRLNEQGLRTRAGKRWCFSSLAHLLHNRAYIGEAQYGKTRPVPRQPRLRPQRHQRYQRCPRLAPSVRPAASTPITIPVPALVSAELFAQVAEQLQQSARRFRGRQRGAVYLLQGLLVCPRCSYACTGMGRYRVDADGRHVSYRYYRCCGRAHTGDDGQPLCRMRAVRAADLEQAVWEDVCALLAEPDRLAQEYERRLNATPAEDATASGEALAKRLAAVKRGISRLIDSYSEGLLEKTEFEPRLRAARERLERLQAEVQLQQDAATRRAELRLVVGKFQEFAAALQAGLQEASWATRREILRALVQQIELGEEDIRIVYRVPAMPLVDRAAEGVLPNRPTRYDQHGILLRPRWNSRIAGRAGILHRARLTRCYGRIHRKRR